MPQLDWVVNMFLISILEQFTSPGSLPEGIFFTSYLYNINDIISL